MKKTKIEQRIENAVNAFFDNESLNENKLSFVNNSALLKEKSSTSFTEKADAFVKILKQVFLFFPGTFVLFNLSLIFTIFTFNPSIGALFHPERLALALLVSAFMTMFGLGDIKKVKHLIIPVSIMLFAFISGFFIAFSASAFKVLDNYAAYLFPLALIVPFLAKGWIDKTDKEKSDI